MVGEKERSSTSGCPMHRVYFLLYVLDPPFFFTLLLAVHLKIAFFSHTSLRCCLDITASFTTPLQSCAALGSYTSLFLTLTLQRYAFLLYPHSCSPLSCSCPTLAITLPIRRLALRLEIVPSYHCNFTIRTSKNLALVYQNDPPKSERAARDKPFSSSLNEPRYLPTTCHEKTSVEKLRF
jgi:hypothetical protein